MLSVEGSGSAARGSVKLRDSIPPVVSCDCQSMDVMGPVKKEVPVGGTKSLKASTVPPFTPLTVAEKNIWPIQVKLRLVTEPLKSISPFCLSRPLFVAKPEPPGNVKLTVVFTSPKHSRSPTKHGVITSDVMSFVIHIGQENPTCALRFGQ